MIALNHTVVLAGAGGLGTAAAVSLAAAGIHRMIIVDEDRVAPHNLPRQWAFDKNDVGKPKADTLGHFIKNRFPKTEVVVVHQFLNPSNILHWMEKGEILIDATDQPGFRLLADDAAGLLQKKWIYGGLSDHAFMMAVLDPAHGLGFRVLFENPPRNNPCTPQSTLGLSVQMAGQLQAWLALKTLQGEDFTGQLRVWNDQRLAMEIYSFDPKPAPEFTLKEYTDVYPQVPDADLWPAAQLQFQQGAAVVVALDMPGDKLSKCKQEAILLGDWHFPNQPFYIYCHQGKKAKAWAQSMKKNALFLGILHE